MFTGIIESVGKVIEKQSSGGDLKVKIDVGELNMSDVNLGDSIAVNGVCLTVVEYSDRFFVADVSLETCQHSRWNDIEIGEAVNLEKAMLPTTRLGGHLVSGHVDGVGTVLSLKKDARSVKIEISVPEHLKKYVAQKGSITVDGVSLTTNELTGSGFLLNIVPHTSAETIISRYTTGRKVHLEVDLLARYVERLLNTQTTEPSNSRISPEFLAQNGFLK